MEAPLEGDALYQYCAESGEPIKGVLAVMSFEQSHPSMPFMPPPIPAPSSNQAKSVRSDEYSNSGRYRRPTSHSETASSMSDLNVLDESESWRASQQQSSAGAYPSSTSETSISTTDMDHLINASGSGPSSLKRKPHQRRSSHLFAGPGGPRRPSSPGGSRRPDNLDGTSMSALSSPNSPPVHLLSPESTLGVDPSQYTRLGSVTPTRPMSADQSTSRSRPTSMSPDEIQHITSTTSIDEQEQILRAIQEDRERDRKMVEEVIRREREEEMAREWERRDREEEEERRRRQIEEDEETAMEEQRKEQELYKVRVFSDPSSPEWSVLTLFHPSLHLSGISSSAAGAGTRATRARRSHAWPNSAPSVRHPATEPSHVARWCRPGQRVWRLESRRWTANTSAHQPKRPGRRRSSQQHVELPRSVPLDSDSRCSPRF